MITINRAAAILAVFLACGGAAFAQNATSPNGAEAQRLAGILASQHRQTGDVAIPGANATLHLGTRYYFLGSAEAKQVLREWGNPPESAEGVLGMVFPAGQTFLTKEGWAGVVTYDDAGYISDRDADRADYQRFLDEVYKGEDDANAQRKKAGFPSVHLVGWAQPPTYDKVRHYMIWARDVQFGGVDRDSLNYDVRVLGRRGFLSVNVVSTMDHLPEIRNQAAQLAAVTSFDPGSTYADYASGSDKKAEYGVAGLVAAGLGLAAAKKFGLLALIALFGKKLIVLIVAGFAALAARVKKLFRKAPDAA